MCVFLNRVVNNIIDAIVVLQGSVLSFMEQLFYMTHIKTGLAFIAAAFTHWFFGNVIVLYLYLGFVTFDLLVGIVFYTVIKQFRQIKLWSFFGKLLGCFLSIVILGGLAHALFQVTGLTIGVVNWLLFIFIIVEAASITEKLHVIGVFNHYPVVTRIIKLFRKYTAKKLCDLFESPEMAEEIEQALGPNVKVLRLRAVDIDESGVLRHKELQAVVVPVEEPADVVCKHSD